MARKCDCCNFFFNNSEKKEGFLDLCNCKYWIDVIDGKKYLHVEICMH